MESHIIDKLVDLLANKVIKEVILEFEESEDEQYKELIESTFIENPYRFCPNCNCMNCMEIKLK
tara:strand:+ start:3751 stop:3942 length:192 start_codon:yes stop_codon:yes gene_type:complete